MILGVVRMEVNMNDLVPYSRKQGLTWKGYLLGNLFTLHGTAVIAKNVVSSISKEIASVGGEIKYEIGKISEGIESLRADFNYGMSIVMSQLEAQQQIQEKIIDKLDDIHKTLKSPLLTQAREYLNIGIERLSRGFLDKSLESFLEAEKKNDMDFIVQMQIGKIYLYGKDENVDLVNLSEAEKHLKLAARYAEAEISFYPEIYKLCSECYLHASIACYIQGNELFETDKERAIDFYKEAFRLSEKSNRVSPDSTEAIYHSAKYLSLLGDYQKCNELLKQIVEKDNKYFHKIYLDGDFSPIKDNIVELENEIKKNLKDEAVKLYDEMNLLLSEYNYTENENNYLRDTIVKCLQNKELVFKADTIDKYKEFINQIQESKSLFKYDILLFSVRKIIENEEEITDFSFSRDAKILVTCDDNNSIKLWDPIEAKLIKTYNLHEEDGSSDANIVALSIFRDNRTLAVIKKNNVLELLNVSNGEIIKTIDCRKISAFGNKEELPPSSWSDYGYYLEQAIFSLNDKFIVKVIRNNRSFDICSIRCQDLSNTECIKEFDIYEDREVSIWSLNFSCDGNLLVFSLFIRDIEDYDEKIEIWDVSNCSKLDIPKFNINTSTVVFSPNNEIIALGRYKEIELINISTGELVRSFKGHENSVISIVFIPNGDILASVDDKSILKLWDVVTGKCIKTFSNSEFIENESETKPRIKISPDGKTLACAIGSKMLLYSSKLTRVEEEIQGKKIKEEQDLEQKEKEKIELEKSRLKAGLCLQCGKRLNVFEKMRGNGYCKNCSK